MTWYLQLNLALGLFGLLAIFISNWNISSRQKIKTHILLLLFSLLVLPTIQFIPEEGYSYPQRDFLQTPMKVATETINLTHDTIKANVSTSKYEPYSISIYIFLIILLMLFRLIGKTYRTYKDIKKTFLFKNIGHVNLMITDKKLSPYSFSLLNKSYIILPTFLLLDKENFKLAAKHELQHIRNKDTFWIYVFEFITAICFFNPVLFLWKKQFLLDQEYACDETLIAQKKVSPRAYATCLMQVADTTSSHNIPFGTAGMAWGQIKPQILRRVIRMKQITKEKKSIFSIVIAISLMFFTASVFALHSPVGELTKTELQKIINTKDFNEFPIEINDQVLSELNRFLSNSNWKEYTKKSLTRYKDYEAMINTTAAKYNLPAEIAAIAFIESGFENLPDRSKSISSTGAGMWQFIPETARNFGLKVDSNIDERLDIPKATDAAMRYLARNISKFKDLRFAMMGYYFGEDRVKKDMDKFGTQDPWLLIEKAEYKTPYLARAMAASILIKYPNLIK